MLYVLLTSGHSVYWSHHWARLLSATGQRVVFLTATSSITFGLSVSLLQSLDLVRVVKVSATRVFISAVSGKGSCLNYSGDGIVQISLEHMTLRVFTAVPLALEAFISFHFLVSRAVGRKPALKWEPPRRVTFTAVPAERCSPIFPRLCPPEIVSRYNWQLRG